MWPFLLAFSTKTKLIIGGVLLVLVLGGIGKFLYAKYQAEKQRADIAQGNVLAAQAQTELLRSVVGDTAAFRRLQSQGDINEKKLEGALGEAVRAQQLTAKALGALSIRFDSLAHGSKLVNAPVNAAGNRVVEDTLTTPPVLGRIRVTAPVDTTKAILIEHWLQPAPMHFSYALGCIVKDKVKVPTMTFTTPVGVTATIDNGVVEPEVCQGLAKQVPSFIIPWLHPWIEGTYVPNGGQEVRGGAALKLLGFQVGPSVATRFVSGAKPTVGVTLRREW